MRVHLGYCILRTWTNEPLSGKTQTAFGHQLFPTRKDAERVLSRLLAEFEASGHKPSFTYDVADAYTNIGDGE